MHSAHQRMLQVLCPKTNLHIHNNRQPQVRQEIETVTQHIENKTYNHFPSTPTYNKTKDNKQLSNIGIINLWNPSQLQLQPTLSRDPKEAINHNSGQDYSGHTTVMLPSLLISLPFRSSLLRASPIT